MLTLAGGFVAAGYAVDVVVCAGVGPLASEVPDGTRVVDLGNCKLRASAWPLARYMRRERPDCLLSAGAMADCVAVWARRLARSNTKVILGLHNAPAVAPKGRMRLLPVLMRWSYPSADGWVAVSQGVAEGFAAHIGLKREAIRTIYNPVVTEALLAKSHERVNHPWFVAGQPPVILGVGRLTRQKDFSNLIRAFVRVRRHTTARLLILGEGEDRSKLEALANESEFASDIAMPGFVENPYAYMRLARVFVLSSLWEGLPTVLIEALACGTSVVSTDCPSGPAEILGDESLGRLVSVGDSPKLADALGACLTQPAPAVVVWAGGKGLDRFTVDGAVSKYLAAIGDLM